MTKLINKGNNMTVVVTSAAGHVGSNLVRTLLGQGRTVRAIVHKDTLALEGLTIDRFTADICSYNSVRNAFEGAKTVFQLASHISVIGEESGLVEEITGVKRPRILSPMWLALIGVLLSLGWSRLTRNLVRFTPESLQALRCSPKLSYEKAVAELYYNPCPLHDTLTNTFKWFDSMGWLQAGWRPTL